MGLLIQVEEMGGKYVNSYDRYCEFDEYSHYPGGRYWKNCMSTSLTASF
jgi:hypothetical protein